jgi:hypothetical protein
VGEEHKKYKCKKKNPPYYESGNSWQWEFLEVCWKFPGSFLESFQILLAL